MDNPNESTTETPTDTIVPRNRAALAPPKSKFGACVFAIPDNMTVYPGRFGGGKSCKAAEVMVPVPSIGMSINASIYARLESLPTGDRIKFDVAIGKGVKPFSPAAKADFIGHVEMHAADWPMLKQARQAAQDVLTADDAPKAPKSNKAANAFASIALTRSAAPAKD